MIIITDIDEVLGSLIDPLIRYYNEGYYLLGNFKNPIKNLKRENFTTYSIGKILNITEEEEYKMIQRFSRSPYFKNIMPLENAVESIKKLSEKHKIIGLSDRPNYLFGDSIFWANRYFGDSLSELYLSNGYSKAMYCKKMDADLIIDDKVAHVVDCSENGIRSYLFGNDKKNYWNQNFDESEYDMIERVENWKEILERIESKDL